MSEVTGKRILGIYDSEDGPVYLTNYGTGTLAMAKASKKMVADWKKAEKGKKVDSSYTYRIEDETGKEPKAEGGSLLTRGNYEEGSEVPELSNAEKVIQLEDKGAAALNNAETPEQRDSIAKNLKKMMGNFTKADRTEAAKLRAEMEGQDTDEELFPLRKSIGGLMNQSLLDSQDFNKDTGFPSVGPAAPALAPRESSITAERGSPTTDFPGDQMKKSLLADERQPYVFGALVKLGTKASRALLKEATKEVKAAKKNIPKGDELSSFTGKVKERNEMYSDYGELGPEEFGEFGEPAVIPQSLADMPPNARETTLESIDDLEKLFSKNPELVKEIKSLKTTVFKKIKDKEAAESFYESELFKISESFRSKAKDMASDAQLGFPESTGYSENARDVDEIFSEIRNPVREDNVEGKMKLRFSPLEERQEIDFPIERSYTKGKKDLNTGGRVAKQEGSLMVPPEMESDMPVDTYPNIPPEEMDEAMASQLPDAEMEDKHMEFVFEESLDDEEQSYLMNALEGDPKLSQIFDKVLTTASEFTGAGEVEGPGTGVSDSIPARLSDGEFVFTDKATEEIGSDNLQTMMDDAERAYDGGAIRKPAQEGGLLAYKDKNEDPLSYEKAAQDEIKKDMLRSNRAPSLNPG